MNHGELIAELESNGFTCKEEPVNLRSDYLTGMYYKMIGPVDTHGRCHLHWKNMNYSITVNVNSN